MERFLNGTSNLPEYAADSSSQDTRPIVAVAFQAAFMVIIMIVALGGNMLILAAIYIDKTLQTITNVFIINLACADLLLTIIGMPFTLASSITYDWIFGGTWCKVHGMANSLFCVASILTLAAVSIDRYFAILYPFKYTTWITNKAAAGMIVYIWFHALLIACLPAFTDWSQYTFIRSESICTVKWESSITFTLFLFSVCFFLPLGAMVFTYLRIFHTAKEQSRKIVPVTGEVQGKDEPSVSGVNSYYESRGNLTGVTLAEAPLTQKELSSKSVASINDNRSLLDCKTTLPADFSDRHKLRKQKEILVTDVSEHSKDSGFGESNAGPSALPNECSAASHKRPTSVIAYDSGETISATNSSFVSFQDFAVFATTELENDKYDGSLRCELENVASSSYANSTSAKTIKVNSGRKTGVIFLPPLQNEVDQPDSVAKTLINNSVAAEEFMQQSNARCIAKAGAQANNGNSASKEISEKRTNKQLNNSSTSRIPPTNSIQTECDDKKLLNIPVADPRCSYSNSSLAHPENGVQSQNFESQTTEDIVTSTTKRMRKRFSTTSVGKIISFSGPNRFRAFSRSSLALVNLRKRKDAQARAKMRRETKAAKTLLIVVGTFVLCWTPHFVGIFCLLIEQCSWPDEFFAITTWLAMLNSACNPVIYGVMSRQFRKRFKQILQCKRIFS